MMDFVKNRDESTMGKKILFLIGIVLLAGCTQPQTTVEWVSTTPDSKWTEEDSQGIVGESDGPGIRIYTDSTKQTIDGFGASFNELGWASLSELNSAAREDIFRELFEPGVGANFTICRMPVAANDFAREWYSYNETEGDFEMENFSIENDYETLIPFIKSARRFNPSLKVWGSPWSPPTWMKVNNHYAMQPVSDFFGNGEIDNGLREDQMIDEGEDAFIQEDRYFEAYALYFQKYVQAYEEEGIPIFMVMPQNEFNSAQWFPSAVWTPEGLVQFMHYLGPAMEEMDVDVFFGTMERPDHQLFETFYQDSIARTYTDGVGFQWAGKGSVEAINDRHPDLKIYQTEHECGNGENSWEYAVYGWDLMKHYVLNGTNAYMYWNISLLDDAVSTWGWRQNSLVTVDEENNTYSFNNDYYLMKHVSHFVKPGAKLIKTDSPKIKMHRVGGLGFWEGELNTTEDNLLAFKNPDDSIVIIIYNDSEEEKPMSFTVDDVTLHPTLKPTSFNTFHIQ